MNIHKIAFLIIIIINTIEYNKSFKLIHYDLSIVYSIQLVYGKNLYSHNLSSFNIA